MGAIAGVVGMLSGNMKNMGGGLGDLVKGAIGGDPKEIIDGLIRMFTGGPAQESAATTATGNSANSMMNSAMSMFDSDDRKNDDMSAIGA